jgi:putative ABC transport system permease protein
VEPGAGSVERLDEPDAVIVDELYLDKLGIAGVGDRVEIGGRRAHVVGLTRGIRTFTTAPPVFTSFKHASTTPRSPRTRRSTC